LRLLADVLGDGQGMGSFFMASFPMGDSLTGKNVLFLVDPGGDVPHVAPDEVELTTWSDTECNTWVSY
jgi:hypothetical protein